MSGSWHSGLTKRSPSSRPPPPASTTRRRPRAGSNSACASGYGRPDYRLAYDAKANDVSKALGILHVPIAALALLLMFAGQRRYYAEHFIFALHYLSFW